MESQRHKKYTNMMGTQQPPAGLSNPDGSATMTSDPSASTSDPQGLGFPLRGILSSPRPNAVLQELDTMEVKEDPDFPPEFRANADPAQKSPRTNMLFSQLTSQVTNNIKPEPMSPRRPNVAGNNSIQVIDPEPLPGPSNADPGAQNLATQNPFHVDTSIISSVPMLQQASELQDLGLTVFDQEQFEQSVMAQVDKKIAAQEQVRINKQLEKQQKTIQEDLRLAKDELAKLEKVLQMFQPQQGNKDVARRLVAVKQQKELKLKQIKKIKAKLKSISLKLTGEVIDLDAEDDVPADGAAALSHALGGGTETEAERMVRLGEMTPFGTIMGFEDPVLSAHKPKKPKEPPKPRTLTSEGSDFNKYIQDQVQKHMQKKKMVMKKKKSSSPTDSVKPKETVEEPSEKLKRKSGEKSSSKSSPSKKLKKTSSAISLSDSNSRSSSNSDKSMVAQKLEIGKSGNMFDLKDKHVYRKKEADMSNVRSRRPRAAGFDHEFADDGVIDLGEVGDEDPDEDLTERRDDDDYRPEIISDEDGDEEYEKDDTEDLEELSDGNTWVSVKDEEKTKQKSGKRVKKKKISHSPRGDRDDGSLEAYEKRLQLLAKEKLRERQEKMAKGEDPESESDGSDMEFDRGYKVPGRIWNKLYRYQKTGVRWLWELHCQQSGGIVGDEMGLGKTIQIIAFLAGIKYSKLRDKGENAKYRGLGPVIIITPATVMHQWVKEFHRWWPEMRVAILHSSGSFTSSEDHLVYNIAKTCGVLITAYSTVVLRQDLLHRHGWHYVILDEGHKIRNPDAQVTLACKMFRTCHRIILSGSPIQNHLKELWSLFDFVFPGKLGTLPDFMQHFSVPIVQGGYSNATDVQVQTSYKCACVLRDTINPYLLRRMKADVQNNIQLPNKSEQVLFCRLTEHQRDVYKEYLESRECKEILDRNFMVFPGLITLRKVCNHPDISTGGPKLFDPVLAASGDPELEYGHWRRAGKMLVVESLLKIWRKQSHRVLLFTQSRMMLDILESFVKSQGYTYMKMDGTTPIASRQTLIQRYNEDPSIYVFLLTTRVGGLGVNLTGADRIIIYDPDWNPSTDLQARERAWRIGQTREVTIYRLLTTGTIEEKIYHRQIFKQFLTNRVLKDPKQRRFFKSNDLYDLFTLGEDDLKTTTETSAIFAGTQSDVNVKVRHRKRSSKSSKDSGKVNRFDVLREKQKSEGIEVVDDVDGGEDSKKVEEERKAKLREMAKRLSQKFGANEPEKGESSNGISPESSQDPSTLDELQQEKVTEKSEKAKKKKKDKKKKKKKRKDAELDGETIANLDKHGTYHKQEEEEDDHKTGDAYVLEKLFKKTGVHSALEHDKIMMASSPDYALVEAEANRVAREAAKALRISRARCQRAETGIPTWTGHSGGATNGVQPAKSRFGKKKNPNLAPATSTVTSDSGKVETKGTESPKPATPKAKPTSLFDGSLAGNMKTPGVSGTGSAEANIMSSSELITRMKARNIYRDKPTDVNDDTAGHTDILEPETMELMTDLRNMVAFGCRVDGQATTQELLDQFAPKLPAGESAKFKAMLENLCEFGRRDGIGVWRLKQEFR